MTLLARRARPVYRVYTEADYLQADADPFADWPVALAEPAAGVAGPSSVAGEPVVRLGPRGRMGRDRASRERRLRRLAGAAALTGAVGTVGGLLGSALVTGRSTGRRSASAAGRLEASTRAAAGVATELPSRHVRSAVPRARGAAGAGRIGPARPARARAMRAGTTQASAAEISMVVRSAASRVSARSARPRVASTVGAAPVRVASAAQNAQAQPAQAAGARGEFGFEH